MSVESSNDWFSEQPSHLRRFATAATTRMAAGLQTLWGNRCADGFGILLYHRIADEVAGVPAPTLNVTPERFRAQLSGLLARGFVAWPLSQLVAAQQVGRAIPRNAFAVTFDDGYENNFTRAWPILRELHVPATIFLATKYLDSEQPFPFDDWIASGTDLVPSTAWRPISTTQCRELLADGLVELGAHTHTHARYLGRGEEFRRDLQQCLEILQERLGIERPTFAFPYGEFDEELVRVARECGVVCSLTTHRRRIFSGDSPFAWGRFDAESNDSAAALAAKLSGWYNAVGAAGKAVGGPLLDVRTSINRWSAGGSKPNRRHEAVDRGKALSQS